MPKKKTSHYDTNPTIDSKQEEQLEPCVRMVVEAWDKWDAHWGSKLSDFERYYDRWIGVPPQRDEDWQSNFHKKLTWQAEKTLVSRFHTALFPVSAPIDTDTSEDVNEFQAIIAKSMVAHWFKIGKFSMEFLKGMKSSSIYGSGLFEDDWYQKVGQVHEKVEKDIPDYRSMVDETGNKLLDEEGNARVTQIGNRKVWRPESRNKILEDRYRVRKSNIFAWRIHPHKLSDDDDYPVIKQEYITYDDLLEFEANLAKYGIEAFDNLDKIKKDRFKPKDEDLRRLQKDGTFNDDKNPRLEILHYWGKYAEQKDDNNYNSDAKQRPMWIMIINRKYRLKMVDNPRWDKKPPLFHINWTEDEKDSYYGIGLAQIGEAAEDRANTNVNTRIDERKKNVKGGGWYNATDKKIKKTQLHKTVPGLYKACSDVTKAVRPDLPIPSTPDDYKEEETSVNDHREATGATTPLLPTADARQQHKTLGGMQLLSGEASKRLRPDLMMMEMMGIRQMANRGLLMTRQFFSQPQAIKLVAEEDKLRQLGLQKIYRLTPQEIISKVEFYCTGLSETFEKLQNIDKLLKFIEVTGRIPIMQQIPQYPSMIMNMLKRIGLWLGIEDVESLVPMIPGMAQGMGQGMPGQMPPGGQPQLPQGQPQGLPPEVISQIAQGMGGQGASSVM